MSAKSVKLPTLEQWRTDVLRVWPEARFIKVAYEHKLDKWLGIDGQSHIVGSYVENCFASVNGGPSEWAP